MQFSVARSAVKSGTTYNMLTNRPTQVKARKNALKELTIAMYTVMFHQTVFYATMLPRSEYVKSPQCFGNQRFMAYVSALVDLLSIMPLDYALGGALLCFA